MNGFNIDNVRKETLQELIKRVPENSEISRACKLKLQYSKTSNAKWEAMRGAVSADGRLRNAYQFAAAQRTKRWGGRIVQPHNLPGSIFEDQELYETAVASIKCGNLQLLSALWGDVSALLSQSIRGAITAEPGKKLVVCDYAAIESRVLGWLSGCTRLNNLFREGLDSYRDLATEIFKIPYHLVTKKQRNYSKAPSLGCGYGLGNKGLVSYAEGFGVDMTEEEARRVVDVFRSMYPEIPQFWENLQSITEEAITRPGSWYQAGYIKAGMVADDMLGLQLPSGRCIYYYQPIWGPQETPWGEMRPGFSYMGMDQYTNQWKRIYSHPGKTTEQVTQGTARELLAGALKQAEEYQLNPIGHVHDEIICEVPEKDASRVLSTITALMSTVPHWAPGLLVKAEGWIGNLYRKN